MIQAKLLLQVNVSIPDVIQVAGVVTSEEYVWPSLVTTSVSNRSQFEQYRTFDPLASHVGTTV